MRSDFWYHVALSASSMGVGAGFTVALAEVYEGRFLKTNVSRLSFLAFGLNMYLMIDTMMKLN